MATHDPVLSLPTTPSSVFAVSGFELWGLVFGLRVWGFRFRVSGFRFQVSGFGFQVSDFGFRVSGFKFQVLGFGFDGSGVAPQHGSEVAPQ